MGKKYVELKNEQLHNSLTISGLLAEIAIQMARIEIAMKEMIKGIEVISDLNRRIADTPEREDDV